jgi:hypothetical protein
MTSTGGRTPLCVTPRSPLFGHAWCGQASTSTSNQIVCNNCLPGQQCTSICTGQGENRTCSVDWYCQ